MNALAKTHPPFTSAEFCRMAEKGAFAGFRVELRRGMILKMSPQHIPHALVQSDVMAALQAAVRLAGLNWKVLVEATVSFGGGFDPMPDIVVVDMDRLAAQGPVLPDAVRLIVEVSDSTLADDMGEKREEYAAAGLAEYWVADVKARTVIRHAGPLTAAYQRQEEPAPLDKPIAMLTRPEIVVQA